jgi:hypothetical protein
MFLATCAKKSASNSRLRQLRRGESSLARCQIAIACRFRRLAVAVIMLEFPKQLRLMYPGLCKPKRIPSGNVP